MKNDDVIMLILIPSFLLTGAWLVWVITTSIRRSRMARYQAELQSKLLDRIGSSQDLLVYLDSNAGQRMLRTIGDQADPAGRVLNAMHIGVVLLMLGIGFLVCEGSLPGTGSTGAFMTFGILSMSLGSGFLIASTLSFLLTRAWGLMPREGAAADPLHTRPASPRE